MLPRGTLVCLVAVRSAVAMGVDAIQTDYPEALVKFLKEAGRR